jgi:hypothetical protein
VHGHNVIVLSHSPRPDTPQLLHVCADTQQQSQVDTEGSDVGSRLTRDPKDTQVSLLVVLQHLGFVDRSDTELTLDGRDERRSLEQSSGQGLETPGETLGTVRNGIVEPDHADVFLSSSLLGLDQPSRPVDTHDQTSGNLGVQGTRVSSLFASEDPLHPGDDLVRRRVGRLVQVDDSRLHVRREISFEGAASGGDGSEVRRTDEELFVVFEEERPLGGVYRMSMEGMGR